MLSIMIVLSVLLYGCGTGAGTSVKVGYSGFDNARTVSIAPHANAKDTGLGAQWNAAHPDSALLIVAVWWQYVSITEAELNIDGEKISLTPISDSTTDFSSTVNGQIKLSTRAFGTNIATVKKIVASKRTWLRIHTPSGYIEDAVIDGAQDSKAYNALIRFIAAVEEK